MNPIHVINQVIEKSAEYNKPLYMTFIGYKKAFYSINTAAVTGALKDERVEETYLRLLDDIYEGCTGRIILHKQSEKSPIRKGVRQGDAISPILFTACLERVFRKIHWENAGIRINWEYLSHLRFLDVTVLLSESAEQLQKMIEELQTESFAMGLKINMNKSQVMINKHAERVLFSIGNETLEQVEEYSYLGQVVTGDC